MDAPALACHAERSEASPVLTHESLDIRDASLRSA